MDWRPIETAPKDGTVVLLYGDAAGEISGPENAPDFHLGFYFYVYAGGDYAEEGYTWVCRDGDAYAVWIKPTHWMPLPAPPQDGST